MNFLGLNAIYRNAIQEMPKKIRAAIKCDRRTARFQDLIVAFSVGIAAEPSDATQPHMINATKAHILPSQ
jgi:hypothetical protein